MNLGRSSSSSKTSTQSGMSRDARGSLTTVSPSSESSSSRTAKIDLRASERNERENLLTSRGRGSSQVYPQRARISSCAVTSGTSSKNPFGFSGRGGARREPASAPSSVSAPAVADVPLRCIPETSTSARRGSDSELLIHYHPESHDRLLALRSWSWRLRF